MQRLLHTVVLLALLSSSGAMAFTLHKKGGEADGHTLLVFGGIQGDEPGGFMAANLLVTHYTIKKGHVWVIPNLNFASIIARSRGVHGDMNRKFARLHQDDPEFDTVSQVKQVITDSQVDVVLNLHDGSGFYRESYVDSSRNPYRWGQSIIIDQESLVGNRFGDLRALGERVVKHVNGNLVDHEHRYALKNTRTRWGNEEMAKTLTFFAIESGKPAFGVEASKSFGTAYRTYYHLQALEGYMTELGIEFERHFPMTVYGVEAAIESRPQIALYGNKVILDVANARSALGYVPLKKGGKLAFQANSPLVAVVAQDSGYQVIYGNRRMTHLHPQFFEYDDSLERLPMVIDGERRDIPLGSIVAVDERFEVVDLHDYRVNLIGYTGSRRDSEAGISVAKNSFIRRFSIDQSGDIYRVEVYRDGKFSGMVLVDFSKRAPQTAQEWIYAGEEIALGDVPKGGISDPHLGR